MFSTERLTTEEVDLLNNYICRHLSIPGETSTNPEDIKAGKLVDLDIYPQVTAYIRSLPNDEVRNMLFSDNENRLAQEQTQRDTLVDKIAIIDTTISKLQNEQNIINVI